MTDALTDDALHVLDGVEMEGTINTSDEQLIANVNHSIRLGYPQVRPQPAQPEMVCLVGGGPSLNDTFDELRELFFNGALIVTVNGSYQWCLDRNIQPSAQIVLDARAENARFVNPAVPRCKYLLASQCHPEMWKQVEGRPNVHIWHGAVEDNPHLGPVLDAYYAGNWMKTPAGTTVIVRALVLLRLMGFLRLHLFGADSCYMHGQHHAYQQPENDVDRPRPFILSRNGEDQRVFLCAPWMAQQVKCFLQTVRLHGKHFLLSVHGDGMLAYALKLGAEGVNITESTEP